MDLSIAVVSWNTRDLLDGCLESVFETTFGVEFEVIAVDNASSDGSAEMVREKYPQVRLIENSDNVGFAAANNQAYAASDSKFFLLLNPDTILHEAALHKLLSSLDEYADCALAAPQLVWGDGCVQESVGHFPSLASELFDALYLTRVLRRRRASCLYVPQADGSRVIDWACGACLLLRRDALGNSRSVLDDRYFMFSEETDLCRTLRSRGWGIRYEPSAVVTHLGSGSTSQVRREMFIWLYQSKFLYFRKHHGRVRADIYRLFILPAHVLVRLAGYLPGLLFRRSDYTREHTHPASQIALLMEAFRWGR